MIPFLIDLGLEPLVAHFFGFYFAIFSAITPPVAVGCMAVTRISGGSFYRTVYECMRLSVICVLIPFTFVAFPGILAFPDVTLEIILVLAALLASTAMWASAVYGVLSRSLRRTERLAILLGSASCLLVLLTRESALSAVPLAAFVLMLAWVKLTPRLAPPAGKPAPQGVPEI